MTSLRNRKISTVACNGNHTCCLSSTGVVYAWGEGTYGQLGLGIETNIALEPKEIPGLQDKDIVNVYCGQNHSIFLSSTGAVYACGNGYYGQLGLTPGIDYVVFVDDSSLVLS